MFGIASWEPTVHTQNPEDDGGTRALCGVSLDTIFWSLGANDPDPQMRNAVRPRMFGAPCHLCARIGKLKAVRTYRDRDETAFESADVAHRFGAVELDTIIAALRFWQYSCGVDGLRQAIDMGGESADGELQSILNIAQEHGHILTDEMLDNLVERLNGGN